MERLGLPSGRKVLVQAERAQLLCDRRDEQVASVHRERVPATLQVLPALPVSYVLLVHAHQAAQRFLVHLDQQQNNGNAPTSVAVAVRGAAT